MTPHDQLSLFGTPTAAPERFRRRVGVNPHLQAARRLSRQIRRLPEDSPEETQAGLAICRALKAYLEESHPRGSSDPSGAHRPSAARRS